VIVFWFAELQPHWSISVGLLFYYKIVFSPYGEPQNQWAVLGAAHQMAPEKSESEILEPTPGIEPGTSFLLSSKRE